MSNYTTGEVAKLCGVSVRTVQFYDQEGILHPAETSEGGRRLYSHEDLRKLQSICFLRGLGLSLKSIAAVLRDEKSEDVLRLLLRQQQGALQEELAACQNKLTALQTLLARAQDWPAFSMESIQDIALTMKEMRKLRRVHLTMLAVGLLMNVLLIGSILLWALRGLWLPFAICAPIVVALGVLITRMYYRQTRYICPACHKLFQPKLHQFIFSAHTPKTRKLTCAHCGHHGFCVEVHAQTHHTSAASGKP